jgi:hypothetical protein
MRIEVNQHREMEIREVFNPIRLATRDGEELSVCMRDTGFEITYQGQRYEMKKGEVKPLGPTYTEMANRKEEHCTCPGVGMIDVSKNKAGVYHHVLCNKPISPTK